MSIVSRPPNQFPTHHGATKALRRGFTLVDLTLTILILGIVAAVSAPRFQDAILYYQVDAATRRIEADINYVRHYAKFTNQSCSLTFAPNGPTYTTTGVPHTNNSGRPYAVDLVASGCPVTVQANLDGGRQITFNASGHPQVGSPAAGLTSGVITVTSGRHSRTVVIDAATGKARRS